MSFILIDRFDEVHARSKIGEEANVFVIAVARELLPQRYARAHQHTPLGGVVLYLAAHLDKAGDQVVQATGLTDMDRGHGIDQRAEQLDVDLARDIVEAVGAVGIKPLADKAVGLQIGLYQLLHEHTDGAALVLADGDPLVPVFSRADTVEVAVLEYIAPYLVERDLQAGVLLVVSGHVARVQLVAQRAESGDIEAGLERCGAEGLVVRTGGNVSADTALGIAVAVALLDMGAAEGVGVVAAPDLREIAEDTQIKAATA